LDPKALVTAPAHPALKALSIDSVLTVGGPDDRINGFSSSSPQKLTDKSTFFGGLLS
jgi:hypothetical protein